MSDTDPHGDPAVTVAFAVTVDGQELGSYVSCTGLAIQIATEKRKEGGANGRQLQFPGAVTHPNIVLTRPMNLQTAEVVNWVAQTIDSTKTYTASIEAMRADGSTVVEFSLQGVFPVKWTGPQFSVESPKVALETLELAHHGFRAERGTKG